MKIYCQNCGSPTEYSSSKPNFCGNCGNKFHYATAVNPPPENIIPKNKRVPRDDDETEVDDDDDGEIPQDLNGELEADIDTRFHSSSKIKDVIKEKPTGITRPTQKTTKKQQKEILQQFFNEAKSTGRGNSTEIGSSKDE